MSFVEQAYNALRHSIYDGLLLQTRLAPLTDSIEIEVADGELKLNFAPMEALMQQAVDANVVNGLTDVIDFNRTTQGKLQQSGWRGSWSFMGEYLRGLTITPEVQTFLDTHAISFLDDGDTSVLEGSVASDILLGNTLGNTLDNVLDGKEGLDLLNGDSGNDRLTSRGASSQLYGGSGNDSLISYGANSQLHGGEGNDYLQANYHWAGAGSAFYGGVGDDTILGSRFVDTVYFNLGDGHDTLNVGQGNDVLKLGAGIAESDITISREGENLVLNHSNGTDKITVQKWFNLSASSANTYKLGSVVFDDGTVWDTAFMETPLLTQHGTSGDDTLIGLEQYGDTIYGGAGNDTIDGKNGADILNGGTGNDRLTSRGASSQLYGGSGNDSLISYGANSQLHGGEGNDYLQANYHWAGAGSAFYGGVGDDTILGSRFVDTVYFNLGDGHDTLNVGQGNDVLKLGAGIAESDITISREGGNLVLNHSNGTDKITVQNWFNSKSKLGKVIFDDGTEWQQSYIEGASSNNAPIVTSTLTDQTSDEASLFSYQLPVDTFTDSDAGDTLTLTALFSGGGTLPSWLSFNTSTQTLSGTPPNDASGDYDINIIATDSFGLSVNTNFTLTINDVINGDSSNDRIINRGDNHTLNGGQGNDHLRAYGSDNTVNGDQGSDRLIAIGHNNIVNGGAGNDRIAARGINNTFNGGDGNDSIRAYGVDSTLNGDAGDDVLYANGDNNTLNGGDGDDRLIARATATNTTFNGGAGDDKITGSSNNDTYLFTAGDGHDTIIEQDHEIGGTDSLQFGEGIEADDLWFERATNDLQITIYNSDDSVTIKDWYADDSHKIEALKLNSGQALLNNQLDQLVQAMASFGVPAAGTSDLTGQIKDEIAPVIAASWG